VSIGVQTVPHGGDRRRIRTRHVLGFRGRVTIPASFPRLCLQDVRAAGKEQWELGFLYWGDAHFLVSAVRHMNEALKGLSNGPRMPKRLRDQIELMRHTLEHWDGQDERKGRWKTLAEKHGPHASPWVAFPDQAGDDADLWIGPDLISVEELEQELARVRDELLDVYNPEDYEGLDVEQVLALYREKFHERYPLKSEGRAIADRLLELIAQEPELLDDPRQVQARMQQVQARELEGLERQHDELVERLHREGSNPPPPGS
jgi:hypothetical protein